MGGTKGKEPITYEYMYEYRYMYSYTHISLITMGRAGGRELFAISTRARSIDAKLSVHEVGGASCMGAYDS